MNNRIVKKNDNIEVKPLPDTEDEKTKHTRLVLIIKNYITHFDTKLVDLQNEYGISKQSFRKLHNMTNTELEVMLEAIRIELCVSKGFDVMNKMFTSFVFGIESLSPLVGMEMNGLCDLVASDPGFSESLMGVACEMSLYTSPRTDLLIKLAFALTTTYKINQNKKSQEITTKKENVLEFESIVNKHEKRT